MWARSQQWLAPNSTTNLLPPKFALLWACSKIFLLFLKFLSRRGANNGLCRTLVHPFTPNFSHIMGQINSICPIPIIFDYIVTQLKTIELQLARANNPLKFSILIYSFRAAVQLYSPLTRSSAPPHLKCGVLFITIILSSHAFFRQKSLPSYS